jgi:hypothetical protein
MTAPIIPPPIAPAAEVRQKQEAAKYETSICGADRHCNHNAPAVEKAAEALKRDPTRSDRAIAKDAGVNRRTVVKARKQLVHSAPEPRTGIDGKTRKVPKRKPEPDKAVTGGNDVDADESAESRKEAEVKRKAEEKQQTRHMTQQEAIALIAAGQMGDACLMKEIEREIAARALAKFKAACDETIPAMSSADLAEARSHFDWQARNAARLQQEQEAAAKETQ